MHAFERWCVGLRHSPLLRRADWLWNIIRPAYDAAVSQLAARGLPRIINGTDSLLVSPDLRGIPESYEPEVWKQVMAAIRPGDTIVDVGAHFGLYTIACGKRVGSAGCVVAFEPHPGNFALLRRQILLNELSDRIEAHEAAVGDRDGHTQFTSGYSVQSHITPNMNDGIRVKVCRLDSVFADSKVDIIKIDVEGFEEKALQGAEGLLNDKKRKPRAIFIGVHPYNWHLCGTSSNSLVSLLYRHGYSIGDVTVRRIDSIDFYGEVIARSG